MKFVLFSIFIVFIVFSKNYVNSQQESCSGMGKKLPKSCKMNKDGFLCCNEGVGNLINDAISELKAQRKAKDLKFNESSNLQVIANAVAKMSESHFNSTFETIVGISNFASKTRFNGDMLCKVKAGKSYVLSYATAKKSRSEGWTAAAAAALAKDAPPIGPDEYDGNFHTFTFRV